MGSSVFAKLVINITYTLSETIKCIELFEGKDA